MKLTFYKHINVSDEIKIFINKDDGILFGNKKYKNVYTSIKNYPYTVFYLEEDLADNYSIYTNRCSHYFNNFNYNTDIIPLTTEEIIDLQVLLNYTYTTNTYVQELIINLLNINLYH